MSEEKEIKIRVNNIWKFKTKNPLHNFNRLSPRSRGQGVKRESQEDNDNSHQHLLVPSVNATHLSIPRTPGVEGSQVRKKGKIVCVFFRMGEVDA